MTVSTGLFRPDAALAVAVLSQPHVACHRGGNPEGVEAEEAHKLRNLALGTAACTPFSSTKAMPKHSSWTNTVKFQNLEVSELCALGLSGLVGDKRRGPFFA